MATTTSTEEVPAKEVLAKQAKLLHLSEHQGNERTYLAWLRTSISLISLGLAINKFGVYLDQLAAKGGPQASSGSTVDSRTVGLSMVVFGILLMAGAAVRYTRVSLMIDRGNYRPNRGVIWVITALVLILGTVSLVLLFSH